MNPSWTPHVPRCICESPWIIRMTFRSFHCLKNIFSWVAVWASSNHYCCSSECLSLYFWWRMKLAFLVRQELWESHPDCGPRGCEEDLRWAQWPLHISGPSFMLILDLQLFTNYLLKIREHQKGFTMFSLYEGLLKILMFNFENQWASVMCLSSCSQTDEPPSQSILRSSDIESEIEL